MEIEGPSKLQLPGDAETVFFPRIEEIEHNLTAIVALKDVDFKWTVLSAPKSSSDVSDSGGHVQQKQSLDDSGKFMLSDLQEGNYEIQVEVTGRNVHGIAKKSFQVLAEEKPNQAPIARLNEDFREVQKGQKVLLSGEKSSDPDGAAEKLSFKWTVVEGPVDDQAHDFGDQPVIELKDLAVGNYTIK